MHGPPETWEMVALGAIAIGVLYFAIPSVRIAIEKSRHAKKDWPGFLLPIGCVVAFVVLLIWLT